MSEERERLDEFSINMLHEQREDIRELRADIKIILSGMSQLEVKMAQVATKSDINPIEARIEGLETFKAEAVGARRVVVAVGTIVAGLTGVISTVFAHFFIWRTK